MPVVRLSGSVSVSGVCLDFASGFDNMEFSCDFVIVRCKISLSVFQRFRDGKM